MNDNRCPTGDEWVLFYDGEVTENRAEAMRLHAASCTRCRAEREAIAELVGDVKAPVPGFDTRASVDRLLRRLDERRAEPAAASGPGARRRRRSLAIAAAILLPAAAATAILPRLGPQRLSDSGEFYARGSDDAPSLRRDVGLDLYLVRKELEPVRPDAGVGEAEKYLAAYRNARAVQRGRVYLTIFAVDTLGTVHWLYPAYEQEGQDPSSVELPPSADETPMPTSVVLDRPSPGRMRIVALITSAPLRVSAIEPRTPGELSLESLRRSFPGADVREWRVQVTPRVKDE